MDYGSSDWLVNGFFAVCVVISVYGLLTGRFKRLAQEAYPDRKSRRQ